MEYLGYILRKLVFQKKGRPMERRPFIKYACIVTLPIITVQGLPAIASRERESLPIHDHQ